MTKAGPLRTTEYLSHMLEAIDRISEYIADMSESSFLCDRRTQDAVVRNFEVIGEACRNIVKHHHKFAEAHVELCLGDAQCIGARLFQSGL